MTKKYLSILISVVLICCLLVSCSNNGTNGDGESLTLVTQTTTQIPEDTTSFKLSYSQSDSLNPYQSVTLNNQILQTLVYESLFTLSSNYQAEPMLASGYSYKSSTVLSVTIPGGQVFSDGSAITTQDIVNSFNLAKKSAHWKNALAPIKSAVAVSDLVVEFQLNYAQPLAQNLLTFAITKTNAQSNGYLIGSGRYVFGEGDGQIYIEVNKQKTDFNPYFTKITLVNITSAESIRNAISIGNISWTFLDLAEGEGQRLNCGKKAVNLNNLVYIGINCQNSITSNANIRKAISLAVDRETLVQSAYQGRANCATSLFNPVSTLGQETAIFASNADVSAAKQAVSQSGYKQSKLKLTILVNDNENRLAAAKLVKQQLEAVGFTVTINSVKDSTYQQMVKSKSFDIYIGETKIPNDMNMQSFFSSNGATSYGINHQSSTTVKAYSEYLNSTADIGNFVLEFSKEMPFVPLVYRQGLICYSKAINGDVQGSYENYFANIEDWHYNK